jgi:hypothetical protein
MYTDSHASLIEVNTQINSEVKEAGILWYSSSQNILFIRMVFCFVFLINI